MKTSLLIPLFLLSSAIKAQDSARLYLNLYYEPVKNHSEAKIIRDAVIKKGKYYISDQFADGRKIMSGVYSSVDPWIEDGLFIYYDNKGKQYAKGNYSQGLITGKWVFYNEINSDTADYELIAFDLNKNKPAKAEKNPVYNTVVAPELLTWLQSRSHFPPRMLGTTDRSRVKVDMLLTPDLNFKPTIVYSEHPDFETEILRLLRLAPDSLLMGRKNTLTPIHYSFELFFVAPGQDNTPVDTSGAAFVFVEEQAMFQGGSLENYREWIQKNLFYPPDAVQNGLSGRVTVQFAVNTDGKVDNIKILRSSGASSLDEEVLRLMNNSPSWTPAKNEGKKVIQQFVMPVIFQLQ